LPDARAPAGRGAVLEPLAAPSAWANDKCRFWAEPLARKQLILKIRREVLVGRRGRERRVAAPCHFQIIAQRGTCGKARGVPQDHRPTPEPAETGVTKCVCCSQ